LKAPGRRDSDRERERERKKGERRDLLSRPVIVFQVAKKVFLLSAPLDLPFFPVLCRQRDLSSQSGGRE